MAVRRSLRNMCALSDLKMNRLLNLIDEWARANGLDDKVKAPHRLTPTEVDEAPPLGLNLASGEIRTIIWATGYRPDYSWLELPFSIARGASSPGLVSDRRSVPAPPKINLDRWRRR
jgi:putative flavoprotein involved in K+ transport